MKRNKQQAKHQSKTKQLGKLRWDEALNIAIVAVLILILLSPFSN